MSERNKNDERKRFQRVNGGEIVEKKKCSLKDGRESVKGTTIYCPLLNLYHVFKLSVILSFCRSANVMPTLLVII